MGNTQRIEEHQEADSTKLRAKRALSRKGSIEPVQSIKSPVMKKPKGVLISVGGLAGNEIKK